MVNHPNRSKRHEWRSPVTAPEKTEVLVFDPSEGVCAARMEIIRGEPFWTPNPVSYESDQLYPTHWMPLPAKPLTP